MDGLLGVIQPSQQLLAPPCIVANDEHYPAWGIVRASLIQRRLVRFQPFYLFNALAQHRVRACSQVQDANHKQNSADRRRHHRF
jgi:hypothetical protein